MEKIKEARNKELIDKAIDYLNNLKETDALHDNLEVRIVTDEDTYRQDVDIYTSIDFEQLITEK